MALTTELRDPRPFAQAVLSAIAASSLIWLDTPEAAAGSVTKEIYWDMVAPGASIDAGGQVQTWAGPNIQNGTVTIKAGGGGQPL